MDEQTRQVQPPKGFKGTPASVWRSQAVDGQWYTLPSSGNLVCLRRPGLQAMIGLGKVPNPLSRNVIAFLANTGRLIDREQNPSEDLKLQQWQEDQKTNIELARLCFVYPRIVDDPQADDEIAGEWLSDFDLAWIIFSFLEGPITRTAMFRVYDDDASTRTDGHDGAALRTDANGIVGAGNASGNEFASEMVPERSSDGSGSTSGSESVRGSESDSGSERERDEPATEPDERERPYTPGVRRGANARK